jgi:hypothetical protein
MNLWVGHVPTRDGQMEITMQAGEFDTITVLLSLYQTFETVLLWY